MNLNIGSLNRKNKSIILLVIIVTFVLLVFCYFDDFNYNIFLERNKNDDGLKSRVNEIVELENKHEFGNVYDDYFSVHAKSKINRDKYIEDSMNLFENKVYSSSITIKDIVLDGNIGYVDRERLNCLDNECIRNRSDRSYRKYIYEKGNWYMIADHEDVFCVRKTGYEIPEEFDRAISLMTQRYGQSDNSVMQSNSYSIKDVKNCLNIQYAESSMDIADAEGAFIFTPSQSMEKFDILVSPKYSSKDDLLTAILLSHEIMHVFDFIESQKSGLPINCFETEAKAFTAQNFFASTLNEEEMDSINLRVIANSSSEAQQVVHVFSTIPKQEGSTYHDKALNFVKNSPVYQEQCKNNLQN